MRIVIVGNGVAGITCALQVRARDTSAEITVVSGESDYFFSRTALMYAFMDRMDRRALEPFERKVYAEQRIERVRDWVVDLHADRRVVRLASDREIPYDQLVLAVGAIPNRLTVDGMGDAKQGVVNFVSMQDLDACEAMVPSTRRAVVVGGGLIGIELVECLLHHGIPTTFLIREPYYWPVALSREEAELVVARMRAHGAEVVLGDSVARVHSSGGRVSGIHTVSGRRIACEMLGVCIGVSPNVDRLRDVTTPPRLGRGLIVDARLQTSLPGVWACGDCAEIHREGHAPLVELIWYSAKRQGAHLAGNLLGDARPYAPPLFFNSSKFFDVEFTTVGAVETLPEGTPTLFRKHPKRDVTQRIVHDGRRVLGFNMLGSRWDNGILSRWIEEQRPLPWVLEHLHEAQMDVELGRVDLRDMVERPLPLARAA